VIPDSITLRFTPFFINYDGIVVLGLLPCHRQGIFWVKLAFAARNGKVCLNGVFHGYDASIPL
jgi:hypothetical protein